MQQKNLKNKAFVGALACCLLLCGCSIDPPDPDNGTYATQYPQSALEYSIYLNKQITVFTNQISTRLNQAVHSKDGNYENEADLAQQSVDIMQDTLDEVTATESSDYSEENRLSVIEAMQTAIDHMKDYTAAVKNGESDLTDYTHSFENDFNALTGLASLYNQ